jgi:Outer membrane protein beta-barrel domain
MKMKYVNNVALIVLTVMLMTPSVSQAQIKFGIRAGLNATNISFEKLPNKSERFGYHIGVFSDVPVMPDFMSLQPELSFSVKGAGFEPPSGKQTLNMNYVDFFLPVAFKLSLFDLQVGLFASYLISKPDYTVFNENKVIIDAFKTIDIGLTGGLSVNINKLLIGVRYNQGFVDVAKDNSRPFLGSGKNAVGQVSLGYRF